MTGRVDILWRIFEKHAKKKNSFSGPKEIHFLANLSENGFWIICDFIFVVAIFALFSMRQSTYINPSGHFIF